MVVALNENNSNGLLKEESHNSKAEVTSFEKFRKHLQQLELWKELAIRPSITSCHPDDMDMLENDEDDLVELAIRCDLARTLMNNNLPMYKADNIQDDDLVPRQSRIPGAGLGLFYEPSNRNGSTIICGEIVCYYTGHIHNFHSSRKLKNKDYLMLLGDDILIDAEPLPMVKARYINDPLDEKFLNCRFVPETSIFRSAVVAVKDIFPGEELFAAYGDAYWSQQKMIGRVPSDDRTISCDK